MRLDFRLLSSCLILLFASSCTNYEYHETTKVPVSTFSASQEQSIQEAELLDVGIVLFDPGEVNLDADDTDFSSVRQSEAVWFTQQLRTTLERSNAWGMVRSLPSDSLPLDLTVYGKIIKSNGEVLTLKVNAVDASGRLWLDKEYSQQASQYSYNPEVKFDDDPFQATFNRIANDLFDFQTRLTAREKVLVRSIAKVKFARDFVPDAFSSYLQESEEGEVQLLRIPASSDPMMNRVERIRSRNDLFVDVIQDYYRAFNGQMEVPYQEWRKLAYKETIYARQLQEQARKERVASLVAIAGGVAAATNGNSRGTRVAGHGSIIAGAGLLQQSYSKRERSLSHSSALRELSDSLEAELEPSIIDLQDRSVTLSGSVNDQYKEWRSILGEMFRLEEGDSPEIVQSNAQVLIEEANETAVDADTP